MKNKCHRKFGGQSCKKSLMVPIPYPHYPVISFTPGMHIHDLFLNNEVHYLVKCIDFYDLKFSFCSLFSHGGDGKHPGKITS